MENNLQINLATNPLIKRRNLLRSCKLTTSMSLIIAIFQKAYSKAGYVRNCIRLHKWGETLSFYLLKFDRIRTKEKEYFL